MSREPLFPLAFQHDAVRISCGQGTGVGGSILNHATWAPLLSEKRTRVLVCGRTSTAVAETAAGTLAPEQRRECGRMEWRGVQQTG